MRSGILHPAIIKGVMDGAAIDAFCMIYFENLRNKKYTSAFIVSRIARLNGNKPCNYLSITRILGLRPRLNWWELPGRELNDKNTIRDGYLSIRLLDINNPDYKKCIKHFEKEPEQKEVALCAQ